MAEEKSLSVILESAKPELQRLSAKYVNIDRLIGLALEMYKRPDLAKCSPMSILAFCKKCAEWKTDRIGPGGVWPVAFKGELTAIPDWRFLVQKAKDGGAIKHATAEEVFENDVFSYSRGMYPTLEHIPATSNRGEFIGAYCVYTLPDGSKDFQFMAADEIEHIRSLAPGKNSPAWVNHPGEMRKKTVVRRTMKIFEGASVELSKILEADAAAMGYIDVEAVERKPVAMPTALTPKDESVEPPKPSEQKPAAKPEESQTAEEDGVLTVTGLVEAVSEKSGESRGKAWTRYGVKVSGEYYNTFSETIADGCRDAQEKGSEITIEYSVNDKGYKDIVNVL